MYAYYPRFIAYLIMTYDKVSLCVGFGMVWIRANHPIRIDADALLLMTLAPRTRYRELYIALHFAPGNL
jgi:hypothetical protein